MRFNILAFLLSLSILWSCGTSKEVVFDQVDFEETLLDTLTVRASKPLSSEKFIQKTYNEEAPKTIDILHMDLSIEPDWSIESIYSVAVIKLKPYFYPIQNVQLDASRMVINKITLENKTCEYTYNSKLLDIQLDRMYTKDETITLTIDYTARPSLGFVPGYLSNDQGMYFIEPNTDFPDKPYQLWTQGETEYNSSWFPTRDKPNEKFTHNIEIIVADTLQTLSNGLLVRSEKLENNRRKDYWEMNKEHAPYLTLVAIGDYAVVKDRWKNIPLEYYVYPEYEAYAQNIFNHTPEMLTYFSDLTGVSYPWQKYSQIVVEDFVAGAMENTTAVTFGKFVQKTDEELIDNHNDDIVAHELFHHWFGDYVTCESWANLTLNEGFANYSEYLWIDHKYGAEAAHNKRISEWSSYTRQTRHQGVHPLIHYAYSNKELMFDAHSYNKGGLTLHYLRHIIGDEAFFQGMNQYLVDNAGETVEIDQLRLAYEKVTGLDLNPFFDQWFLSAGHPDFEIVYSYNQDSMHIDVQQIQDPKTSRPVFNMPLEWNIYMKDGSIRSEQFFINERKTRFTLLGLTQKDIEWINFDPAHVFIGEYLENRDSSQYIMEYKQGDQYDKREALDILGSMNTPSEFYRSILAEESNYINKIIALFRYPFTIDDKGLIRQNLESPQHVSLTAELLKVYQKQPELVDISVLNKLMNSQESMSVINRVMFLLYQHSKADFEKYYPTFLSKNIPSFIEAMHQAFLLDDNISYANDIWNAADHLEKRDYKEVISDLLDYLKSGDKGKMDVIFKLLSEDLKNDSLELWQRNIIIETYDELKRNMINEGVKTMLDVFESDYKLVEILK